MPSLKIFMSALIIIMMTQGHAHGEPSLGDLDNQIDDLVNKIADTDTALKKAMRETRDGLMLHGVLDAIDGMKAQLNALRGQRRRILHTEIMWEELSAMETKNDRVQKLASLFVDRGTSNDMLEALVAEYVYKYGLQEVLGAIASVKPGTLVGQLVPIRNGLIESITLPEDIGGQLSFSFEPQSESLVASVIQSSELKRQDNV